MRRLSGPRVLLASSLLLAAAGYLAGARLSSGDYLSHIRYLASDELKGRGNGTPELDKAAQYLAKHFQSYGAKPAAGGELFPELFADGKRAPGSVQRDELQRARFAVAE